MSWPINRRNKLAKKLKRRKQLHLVRGLKLTMWLNSLTIIRMISIYLRMSIMVYRNGQYQSKTCLTWNNNLLTNLLNNAIMKSSKSYRTYAFKKWYKWRKKLTVLANKARRVIIRFKRRRTSGRKSMMCWRIKWIKICNKSTKNFNLPSAIN